MATIAMATIFENFSSDEPETGERMLMPIYLLFG